MRACLQELLKLLEENHGNCAETLSKKAAADASSAVTVSPGTPNVLRGARGEQTRKFKGRPCGRTPSG